MQKIKMLFYLVVVDFISDWYSIHKVAAKSQQDIQITFRSINKLRGLVRTKIEEEEYENEAI